MTDEKKKDALHSRFGTYVPYIRYWSELLRPRDSLKAALLVINHVLTDSRRYGEIKHDFREVDTDGCGCSVLISACSLVINIKRLSFSLQRS